MSCTWAFGFHWRERFFIFTSHKIQVILINSMNGFETLALLRRLTWCLFLDINFLCELGWYMLQLTQLFHIVIGVRFYTVDCTTVLDLWSSRWFLSLTDHEILLLSYHNHLPLYVCSVSLQTLSVVLLELLRQSSWQYVLLVYHILSSLLLILATLLKFSL